MILLLHVVSTGVMGLTWKVTGNRDDLTRLPGTLREDNFQGHKLLEARG